MNKFIDAIPQAQWDKYINNMKDERLKRVFKSIRNKEPDAFGIILSIYTNRQGQATMEKNLFFDMIEKAGVKIDKEPGGIKYHIHMEEI